METDNDVLNKAVDAICAIVGNAHEIAVKGGVNNKKVVIDDVMFTALVEDEITQTKKGLVVNRVNNIRHDSNDPILVITKYIPAEVAKELKQMKINYLDVSGNVLFGPRRWGGVTRKDEEALVRDTLATVGLEGVEQLMPSELSGGMRKRVGIARALALKPKVMLYDEPTTGLAPITTYTIDALIAEVRRLHGITTLVVSHDVSSVFRTADRIAFLEGGKLTFMGTAADFSASDSPAIRELVDKSRAESFVSS